MDTLVERIGHGPVTELKLARPPVNALDPALCAALRRALSETVSAGALGIVLSGGASKPS